MRNLAAVVLGQRQLPGRTECRWLQLQTALREENQADTSGYNQCRIMLPVTRPYHLFSKDMGYLGCTSSNQRSWVLTYNIYMITARTDLRLPQ